jgi:integrase
VTVENADRFIHHVATTPDHREKLRTGTTVNKYRDSLSAYFRWAAKRPGWDVTNVFADIEVPKDARPKQAQTFDSFNDAQAMEYRSVARELWTRREKLEQVSGRTRDLRNVIDIMIGLGLRPKEACQLHSSNVIEDNGRLVLDVTTLIDESDPAWRPSLKTDHSVRQLPVPDGLVSLVEEQVAAANGKMLFPTFANLKKYTGPLERDVADHIKPKCSFAKNPRLVTYSHRHRFRDLCAKAGLPYQIFLAVFGHADDNPTTSRYGDKSKWNAEKLVWLNRVFPLAFPNGR